MFTREDTKKMKGVAITLTLMHHLWAFPARMPTGMEYSLFAKEEKILALFGLFCQICVPVFMFLGGYGLWQKTRKEYSLASDIFRLYQSVWRVALLFIPIGLLFFRNQPDYAEQTGICHVFDDRSVGTLLKNFLCIESTYNWEWWFLLAYLGALVVGYVFIQLCKGKNFWCDAVLVVLLQVATQKLAPGLLAGDDFAALRGDWFYHRLVGVSLPVFAFLMGIVFAKHDALAQLRQRFQALAGPKWMRLAASLLGLGVVVWSSLRGLGQDAEIVTIPFLIVFALEWLDLLKPLGKAFLFLGQHCTNVWLTHSFYCYYFYPSTKLVFWSRSPYVALVTLLALSLASSVLLNFLWGWIGKFWKKIKTASA